MQDVRDSQIYYPAYFMDLNILTVHVYNKLFIIEKTYIFACGESRQLFPLDDSKFLPP